MTDNKDTFVSEVSEKLGYYVYRLVDPRNGKTFYVGKGKEDRVFQHQKTDGEDISEKIARINEIQSTGIEISQVIHRHGMNEDTALEVEAALIDAYTDLTNIQGGHDSGERGAMNVTEIIELYSAEQARFEHGYSLLMLNISKSVPHGLGEGAVYEAVRCAWKIDTKKAEKAHYILAIAKGLIKGVFTADSWKQANIENFPDRAGVPKGRYGFYGKLAPHDIQELYLNKRLPDAYIGKKGAANPIRYSYE